MKNTIINIIMIILVIVYIIFTITSLIYNNNALLLYGYIAGTIFILLLQTKY